MDVFEYRTARSLNTEGVFTNTNPNSEMSGIFIRLKNLMISELHLQWDTAFLEQYIKEQMVPRGLRWDIHPQQDELDLESWYKYFNEVGIKLLGYLVEKKRIRLSLIDTEIKDLRDKLIPFKTSAEYIALSNNLRNVLEKEEKDQRNKKQKKYNRDYTDYTTHSVFNWQKKLNPSSSSGNGEPTNMETSTVTMTHTDRTLVYQPTFQPTTKKVTVKKQGPEQGPYRPPRGPPPFRGPRGKDPGWRGPPRGRPTDPQQRNNTRGPLPHYGPPQGHHGPQHPNQEYGYHTPVRVTNRFTPLRENTPYETHGDTYGYSEREEDYYHRSPYNYNQNQPGPSYSLDFQRTMEGHLGYTERKEGPEGGGGHNPKRKRT